MNAKYPGRCKCGADVEVGYEIWMEQGEDGKWRVSKCPACSDLSRGRADTGAGMKSVGSNLQRRIERANERRRKQR
jgi:hypothetical protein